MTLQSIVGNGWKMNKLQNMRRRFVPIVTVLCAGIVLSFIVFFVEQTRGLTRIRADFDQLALERINTLKREIDVDF